MPVYTDNNPLTYILTSAHLNATGHRWVAELADFQSDKYRPGKANGDDDGLSRIPRDIGNFMDKFTAVTSQETIGSYVNMVESRLKGDITWISSVTMNIELVNQDIQDEEAFSSTDVQRVSDEQLRYDQRADRDVGREVAYMVQEKRSTTLERRRETESTRFLMRKWDRLVLAEDQILRRRKGDKLQLVLPQKYYRMVLKQLHNEMGHLGSSRVFQLAQDRFFWPRMQRDIELYCTKGCS